MSSDPKGMIHSASEGGVTGKHSDPDQFLFVVGTSTSGEYNAAHLPLRAVACWKVEDVRFAFDSSFVTFNPQAPSDPTSDPTAKPYSYNDIRDELRSLAAVIKDNPGCPLSVFGHADPSYEGNFELGSATQIPGDEYNKALSGRRATAVYALLTANKELDTSVSMWQQIATTENWGSNQRQVMQQATGLPDGTPMPSLIRNYLQTLCPKELSLGKKDFLGQGADSGGKGDYQGCGRFNPLVLFSAEDEQRFKTAYLQKDQAALQERNTKNAPNRRVMALLFNKGSKVDPSKWPCPRATEGIGGCVKRFWSQGSSAGPHPDGQSRRSTHLPDEDQRYKDTKKTFACRFYQLISNDSPCESVITFQVRLYDDKGVFIPNARCKITMDQRNSYEDNADDRGIIVLRDVAVPQECYIEWGPIEDQQGKLRFSNQMLLVAKPDDQEEAQRKLNNLGYVDADATKNIKAFQFDYGDLADPPLDVTGQLNKTTADLLARVYNDCEDQLRGVSIRS